MTTTYKQIQGTLLDRSGRLWAEDDDVRSPFGPIRKGLVR